jgi:hypothetical protein
MIEHMLFFLQLMPPLQLQLSLSLCAITRITFSRKQHLQFVVSMAMAMMLMATQ